MIVTEIYDGQGLGNQLWCYITTRVIAKDKGYKFGIKSPEKFKGNDFLNLDFGQPVVGGEGPEGGPPRKLPQRIKYYYQEKKTIYADGTDIRGYDDNLVAIPDKTKIDGVMQHERYVAHRKDEIKKWLQVKPGFECLDYASDDICVINFRGGEYVGVRELFLPQKYWDGATTQMRKINPNFKFVVITDDPKTAKKFFPKFEIHHFSIAKDYVILKNARYLILSNSSFAILPAWINENLKLCIAPKYWARHNVSDGYWATSQNIYKNMTYLDREGELNSYPSCIKEFNSYRRQHRQYFDQAKIKDNFLVISNYNNDLSWVPEYTDNYLVYDRSDELILPPTIDYKKVIKQPNIGYNIYDYLTYIIDHYEILPKRVIFAKGNVFPRHIDQQFFNRVVNKKEFTPIVQIARHDPKRPAAFFSSDGQYNEINNSWYLKELPARYVKSYNDLLRLCYLNPDIPRYVKFAPGANYIVPKENIKKLPKIVYQNLRYLVSYTQLPGEAHILERMLYTLWTTDHEINPLMLNPVSEEVINKFFQDSNNENDKLMNKRTSLANLIAEKFLKISSITKQAIANYRQTIKIYDAYLFFNELDLLEIRLNILNDYVDYFVVIESTKTFTGKDKPLYYLEHKDRFKKFEEKIIHFVIKDTPDSETELRDRLKKKGLSNLDKEIINYTLTSTNVPPGETHWLREFYQKESIKKALTNLSDNDFCYISDVDEIWNPRAVVDYRQDKIFKFRQLVYAYFLNNRSDEPWAGTTATTYKNIRDACLNHLRTKGKTKYTYIKNGGWHFTNQGGLDQIKKKLESYGHQEYNNDEIKSALADRLKNNQDFIGRGFHFWVDESDLPQYIINNKAKYRKFFR